MQKKKSNSGQKKIISGKREGQVPLEKQIKEQS